jgi:hypothetical protein
MWVAFATLGLLSAAAISNVVARGVYYLMYLPLPTLCVARGIASRNDNACTAFSLKMTDGLMCFCVLCEGSRRLMSYFVISF